MASGHVHRNLLARDRHSRLLRMEQNHFWFVGRRRLVMNALAASVDQAGPHIDVGCGTGRLVAELWKAGHRAIGIDLDPERLAQARASSHGPNLVAGSATGLPIRSASAQVVTMLDVLEHLHDTHAVREAFSALRPGGLLIVSVPAHSWLWSSRDEAAGHLRRYGRRQIEALVESNGFRVQRLNRYQFTLFPVICLSRGLARLWPAVEQAEEMPGPLLNRLLAWINTTEARLSRWIRWPWGSSFFVVCRKPVTSL